MSGEESGSIISLNDVSSLNHEVEVVINNKNIIPYPYAQMSSRSVTINADQSITFTGEIPSFVLYDTAPFDNIKPNETYTLSVGTKLPKNLWLRLGFFDYSADGGIIWEEISGGNK